MNLLSRLYIMAHLLEQTQTVSEYPAQQMAIYRKQKHHYQSELWHETEGGGIVEDNVCLGFMICCTQIGPHFTYCCFKHREKNQYSVLLFLIFKRAILLSASLYNSAACAFKRRT